jgi:hypothetical protein
VTREGTRPLAALVVAALAAALLAACGGSDSSSNANSASGSSTATDATAQTGTQEGSSQNRAQKNGSQGQSGGQGKQEQAQQESSGSGHENVETPLEVSGGGSEQFRTKGGDNSIQEYGEESDESELREAAEAVHGFYVSRAEERWETACSYLSKENLEQLEQLANRSSQYKGANCATVLKAFTQPLPAAVQREITTVDAGSLRREGEHGFLIYYGADHVKYAMPLRDEGGTWKLTALSATTLG